MALELWRMVIERTGLSKFQVDRARLQFAFALRLLEIAEAEVQVVEHAQLPDQETVEVDVPDVDMVDE